MCDPCHLGGKALDKVALLAQETLGDQHRKIDVFHADSLKTRIEVFLYCLPDRVSGGLVYHKSLDV